MEVLSGWVERERGKDHVRLVYLDESGEVRARSFAARWSFFVSGLDDSDRQTLQRLSSVVGISEEGRYLRVDCSSRWEREKLVGRIQETIDTAALSGPVASEVCEGDVGPLRRLLSDVPALHVSTRHRACYVDLEVDSRLSIEKQREGKARVLAWCVAWVDPAGEVRHRAAVLPEDSDDAERELLSSLLGTLAGFDLVLAWFGDLYDFEVISRRAVRLDAKLPSGRFPIWNRWCWLDHAEVFFKYNLSAAGSGDEKASMKLNDVAERIVGEGKHDFDASRTWESWIAGGAERRRLLAYCVQDTRLLPRIEAATGYVELHREVCRICAVLPHTNSLKATQQGDGYLLRIGAERGHRWPTLRFGEEGGGAFEGAYVFDPTRTGAIDDVSVCDFAGLYPSIMRSFNMSPETEVLPFPARRLAAEGVPLARMPERRTFFRTDVRGLIPDALDDLQAKRDEYKREMKGHVPGSAEWKRASNLSAAFKIVINSFYGIVGSPWSRFYNRAVAEGVTTTGAWLLKHSAKRARERGFDPFYGDTDSLFVAGADLAEFGALVDELNAEWPKLLEDLGAPRCHIELDFEKRFRRMILVKAKRYAAALGWYKGRDAAEDAPPEVKGLEYKRGDSLRVARRFQEEAIRLLLRPGDLPPAEELRALVDEWKERVYGGGVGLEDLVQSQSVKALGDYAERYTTSSCPKPCGHDFGSSALSGPDACPRCGLERKVASQPPHVRVAKMLVERGEQVNPGDRIRYLVRRSEGSGMDAVPAADVAGLDELDLDYYWLKRILPPTARVLDVVYPSIPWTPTAAQRREEIKARAIEENRGKIDDLPLFGASPEPLPGRPKRRRRRDRKEKPPERLSTARECVATFAGDRNTTPLHLRAAKAAAEAAPGPIPLVVVVDVSKALGAKKAVVRIPTGMGVARSADLRRELEELGAKVSGLPGGG